MTTNQTLDEVLEHYGIKGMRWGVRRTPEQIDRARARRAKKGKPNTPVSEDAKEAATAQKKASEGGVSTLSNQELEQLNKRLNLEKNYKDLTAPPKKAEKKKRQPLSKQEKEVIAWVVKKAATTYMSKATGSPNTSAVGKSIELYNKDR